MTDYEATLEKLELHGGSTNFKAVAALALCKRLRGKSLGVGQNQNDWVMKLENVGRRGKCVILYDAPEKRAWLVDGYSALVHLFRASLQNDSEGRSRDLYRETKANDLTAGLPSVGNRFTLAKLDHLENLEEQKKPHEKSSSVPFAILSSREFCSQELRRQGYGPTSTGTDAGTRFYVADRIIDLVEGLEKIQDLVASSSSDPKPAVGISTPTATVVEGYDFWDVASLGGAVTLQPKSLRLHQVAKGWLKFTRDIKAMTLFGSGFGNILRPAKTDKDSCNRCLWNMQMPLGKDILALTVADLEYLHREEWRTTDTNDRMVRMLFPWRDPASCFNPCQLRISGTKMICSSPVHMQPFVPPPDLKAVVYSKAKGIARKVLHPSTSTTQRPSALRGTKFCRSGAILLGVPDGDLLRGKIAFAAPEDDTTPAESTAYPEPDEVPSAFSGTDRDRGSATSPSEARESSTTSRTESSSTIKKTEEQVVVRPPMMVLNIASRAKEKERAHGQYPDIDRIYQAREREEASSTRIPRPTAADGRPKDPRESFTAQTFGGGDKRYYYTPTHKRIPSPPPRPPRPPPPPRSPPNLPGIA